MKEYFLKNITEILVGRRLSNSLKKLLNEAPNISKDTLGDVIAQLIYRISRIGMLGFLIAITPILLFVQQNRILKSQNELIQNQNDRIESQNHLIEADRRSSLMLLFGNLLDIINSELKTSKSRELSKESIGQIVSLSKAFKPYRYLFNGSLINREISPERAQLLLFLVNSEINKKTLDLIYEKADFSKADLLKAELRNAYLKGANLSGSLFTMANLAHANLQSAKISNCEFIYANLVGANLSNSDMRYSNFDYSNIVMLKLDYAFTSDTAWFESFKVDDSNLAKAFELIQLSEEYGVKLLYEDRLNSDFTHDAGYRIFKRDSLNSDYLSPPRTPSNEFRKNLREGIERLGK